MIFSSIDIKTNFLKASIQPSFLMSFV